MPATSTPFAVLLRTALSAPLPGEAAQWTMAPSTRPNISFDEARTLPCREASVLAPVFASGDEGHIVLTLRPAHLSHHPGQIAFPGGRREPGETALRTALREAHEEIGLHPEHVEVVGALTPLYIPPSNYCVFPFVGVVVSNPPLAPLADEVAEVIRLPVARLLAPEARQCETWTYQGRDVQVPCFFVGTHRIWGATAMILAELRELLLPVLRGNP